MYSDDVNDVMKRPVPLPKQAANYKRVAQVYKDTEANTDPQRAPNQQQVPPEGIVVTPETVDELTKAIYHLQQVVMKLRGGA
jgi:hypothetical protein